MNWKAIGVVVFAPLVGAIAYALQSAIQWMRFETAAEAFKIAMFTVPFGWLYGLVLTLIVGLPIGFLSAWLLKRAKSESLIAYGVMGSSLALCFSMALPSRQDFWLPITLTGLLLGLGYWGTAASKKCDDA